MKNFIKCSTTSVKKHVSKHRFGYTLALGLVGGVATANKMQDIRVTQWNDFLDEKGIDREEFYCPEAYAEKQQAS